MKIGLKICGVILFACSSASFAATYTCVPKMNGRSIGYTNTINASSASEAEIKSANVAAKDGYKHGNHYNAIDCSK